MMQTIETTAIESAAVVDPCPFCGAEPFWLGTVIRGPHGRVDPVFYHPGVTTDKDCVLSGKGFSLDEVETWNRRSSAPQEPDDALIERVAAVLEEEFFDECAFDANNCAKAVLQALGIAQEPVADDDAEWLLEIANNKLRYDTDNFKARLRAIASRLQAKAPETDYSGIVRKGEG